MLRINDDWMLDADPRCWILCKRVIAKKTGKITFRPTYFFPTLESVSGWFVENEGRAATHELADVDSIIRQIIQAKADMAESLRILSLDGKNWHKAYLKGKSSRA